MCADGARRIGMLPGRTAKRAPLLVRRSSTSGKSPMLSPPKQQPCSVKPVGLGVSNSPTKKLSIYILIDRGNVMHLLSDAAWIKKESMLEISCNQFLLIFSNTAESCDYTNSAGKRDKHIDFCLPNNAFAIRYHSQTKTPHLERHNDRFTLSNR